MKIHLQLQHFVEILAPKLIQEFKDMGESCYNSTISKVTIINHIQLYQKCSVEAVR